MTDHNTKQRQLWLRSTRKPDESKWWWAIGVAALLTLFMVAGSIPA